MPGELLYSVRVSLSLSSLIDLKIYFKRTVPQDGYFSEGLNILISTFFLCAEGKCARIYFSLASGMSLKNHRQLPISISVQTRHFRVLKWVTGSISKCIKNTQNIANKLCNKKKEICWGT
jgi:hypothetical protein